MSDKPRIAFLEHVENGVLTDAQSVTLADPSGMWGIREAASEAVVIPPNTPVVRVDIGMYEFDISSLNTQIEYEIFWKVINSAGNVEYVLGIIPVLETGSEGSGGPTIPPELDGYGIAVDIDGDGVIDGYKYDLDGDGYAESYDLDFDKTIDQVDIGTVKGYPNDGSQIYGSSGSGSQSGHTTGGGDTFDPRGVRVGLGGNTGSSNGVTPPLDMVPDVPSARGQPASNGVWGGTFGYDGTSGNVPATGGERTNRSGVGDGHWDGISFEKLCNIPIGARGQCIKDKAHALTRVMLKDTDPSCAAFSDDEIDMLLEGSLWAFNAKPTFTAFLWDGLQERWLDIIVKGAVIWGLYSQGLLEAGREFTITDNGISYTPPPVSDKLHNYASALLAHYEKELMDIKQNFRPIPAAVGIFSVLDISPSLKRLRHLREKRIF